MKKQTGRKSVFQAIGTAENIDRAEHLKFLMAQEGLPEYPVCKRIQ